MLPNHSPLVIAEQFGTLESLYPGRIDLGLGRAPGTDQLTLRALRRDPPARRHASRRTCSSCRRCSATRSRGRRCRPFPGTGTNVPLWILGSSLFGAQLAAALGLPYAFASHFAPDALMQALEIYRDRFQPSEQLRAAARDGRRQRDRGRHRRRGAPAVHVGRSRRSPTAARPRGPAAAADRRHRGVLDSPEEKAQRPRMLRRSFVGSQETVCERTRALRRGDGRRRADRRSRNPRSHGASSLVRAPRCSLRGGARRRRPRFLGRPGNIGAPGESLCVTTTAGSCLPSHDAEVTT